MEKNCYLRGGLQVDAEQAITFNRLREGSHKNGASRFTKCKGDTLYRYFDCDFQFPLTNIMDGSFFSSI